VSTVVLVCTLVGLFTVVLVCTFVVLFDASVDVSPEPPHAVTARSSNPIDGVRARGPRTRPFRRRSVTPMSNPFVVTSSRIR